MTSLLRKVPIQALRRLPLGRGRVATSVRRGGAVVALQALLCLGVGLAPPASAARLLAATPPMGWNDWAHYQCRIDSKVILANARALVKTGLAARGFKTKQSAAEESGAGREQGARDQRLHTREME